jgi:hypothetical protein
LVLSHPTAWQTPLAEGLRIDVLLSIPDHFFPHRLAYHDILMEIDVITRKKQMFAIGIYDEGQVGIHW